METNKKSNGLPDNAFRPLKQGEKYEPLMSPDKQYPEVNAWSVSWGIIMAVLFSAASAYLGLKVGQVFEAAIPIAIIAVGISGAVKRKNPLGENVIIQSIGACSGVIVAGAIFTLPALYILQEKYPEMTVNFFQMFISSLLGGILGILFLIPFRKYFVSEKHGEYPFPEATASTQVLISGEKGGSQAKPLLYAGLVGGLYDFIVATFGWWNENVTTRICSWGELFAEKTKVVLKINTGAAVLGLGYIVGLKYAAIICAGSLAVWLIIVPGISLFWGDQVLNTWNPELTATIGSMSPETIFNEYAKSIGIGGIAMAGIIGIIRSWNIIKGAVSLATKEMKGKKTTTNVARTQKDLSMKIIVIGSILTIILTAIFFYFDIMRRNKSCFRNDFNDTHLSICCDGSYRIKRINRNGSFFNHGRCCLYSTLYGWWIYYRFKNRILARKYSCQTRELEIFRNACFSCNCWRGNHDIERNIQFFIGSTCRATS